MSVRPAKTLISLGIHSVWSESSQCAQWVVEDPRIFHADSEDCDQTGRMPRLIWVFAGRTAILLVLSCRGSFFSATVQPIYMYDCWNKIKPSYIGHVIFSYSLLSDVTINSLSMLSCKQTSHAWQAWIETSHLFLSNTTAIIIEPPHDKTNKVAVRPAKAQISLGIRPVWSQSSLCAQWVAKDPSFLHADSKDWSDWADAQADLSLRWAHSHFVGFVMRRLNCFTNPRCCTTISRLSKLWSTYF